MLRLLIDANVPPRIHILKRFNCEFIYKESPPPTDIELWSRALNTNQVIITKDADFYYRSLQGGEKPDIIHIRLGNMSIKDFDLYFENHFDECLAILDAFQLVELLPSGPKGKLLK